MYYQVFLDQKCSYYMRKEITNKWQESIAALDKWLTNLQSIAKNSTRENVLRIRQESVNTENGMTNGNLAKNQTIYLRPVLKDAETVQLTIR